MQSFSWAFFKPFLYLQVKRSPGGALLLGSVFKGRCSLCVCGKWQDPGLGHVVKHYMGIGTSELLSWTSLGNVLVRLVIKLSGLPKMSKIVESSC